MTIKVGRLLYLGGVAWEAIHQMTISVYVMTKLLFKRCSSVETRRVSSNGIKRIIRTLFIGVTALLTGADPHSGVHYFSSRYVVYRR